MIKKEYFQTGEAKKLAPQSNSPWTVLEKLANFRVQNDSTKKKQVVHHNRLYPAQTMDTADNTRPDDTRQNEGEQVTQEIRNEVDDTFLDGDSSNSDESDINTDHLGSLGQNRRTRSEIEDKRRGHSWDCA